MTLLLMDGFDNGDRLSRYPLGTGTQHTSTTRFGYGQAIQCNNSTNLVMPFTASATIFFGFAFNLNSQNGVIAFFGDGNTTNHVSIVINADGSWSARRGSTTGTILASGAAASLSTTGFHSIEGKITISDTVGVIELRYDGSASPFCNVTSADTKNGGTNVSVDTLLLRTGSTGASGGMTVDDFYLLNSSGSAPNNTFLGDVRVMTVLPNGNGNYSQLTGSDGNSTDNYLLVDEATVNTSDYVGGVSGLKDSYTMENLSVSPTTIFGVQEVAYAAKSDAGAANFKHLLRISSTDYTTSSKVLSTTYTIYLNLRETSPATATAWTESEVNGLEAGIETA